MTLRVFALGTAIAAALVGQCAVVLADQIPSRRVDPGAAQSADARLKAIPMQRTVKSLRLKQITIDLQESRSAPLPKVVSGSPGTAIAPAAPRAPEARDSGLRNYGAESLSEPLHYSDSRVISPLEYPYRATGKLIFKAADNKTYTCSAALISNSILATAGHCVHTGGNGAAGWIKSAEFYPAYEKGPSSYGSAKAVAFFTTTKWFNTGELDLGYDVGLIVLDKRVGTNREIGKDVGSYGFCYADCLQPYWSNTQIGYPGNYYGGEVMTQSWHMEMSDGFDYVGGSGMEGGSSGGPHVANFGEISDSSTNKGRYTSRNVLFAVTSWGIQAKYKVQGFSSTSGPNNQNKFKEMFNDACKEARRRHGTSSCKLL